jgi:glutamate racemase
MRAIRAQMPGESIIYFGDQGHIPYGPRPLEQIRAFSEAITNFLLERDAKIIVVACNTASAAALKYLRVKFPHVQFVGMEPAVKPAAETTQTGRVGVLATPATFQGALYASVVERFANGVELLQNTCNGLVQQIEQGNLNGLGDEENIGGRAPPDARKRYRYGRAGVHPLSVRDTAHSGDRRGKGAGDRPGPRSGEAGQTSAGGGKAEE